MNEGAPLETEIRRMIAANGPMPVSKYMSLCLGHPEFGYYVCRDPLGASGDFITAPEISQMFGELIGLWMSVVWWQMGSPEGVQVIELGPGRGTLMSDALRAARTAPAFSNALSLHLVEISPALRARQAQALSGLTAPKWYDTLEDVPEGPSIIIANEFIDALPIHQAVKQPDGWYERMVHIDADGNFAYALAREPIPNFDSILPARLRGARNDDVFEWRTNRLAMEIGRRVGRTMGAALLIDYGHVESSTGDTFQAAARHAYTDPLGAPGFADLTAHVDFEALALDVGGMGANVHGPITQAEWLLRLGIAERATALKARANLTQHNEIDAALARLTGTGRTAMGEMFKVIAFTDSRIRMPPGFDS